ncbi:MAG TPA: DUF2599 domain-containing protein [Actinocrinis sp.]|nr:DUF2599 domain-containing protein [Actinocrinis sp.]
MSATLPVPSTHKVTARARFAHRLFAFVLVFGVTPTIVVTQAAPAQALTYAVSAHWVNNPLGGTLSIIPTGIAQTIGISAATGVWNNALGMAGVRPYSTAVYNSLFEQLQCHLFFRFKTPFNLDTWRPSVSWAAELADKCNPA